jgi:hypothetical protein
VGIPRLQGYWARKVTDEWSIPIDRDLVAWKEPGRDAWQIRALGTAVGRVVKTSSGFDALKPGGDGDYYIVGTFISLEAASKALSQ